MKLFHISDVLTITTGRLVSNRHVEGIYETLNFLTGDNLMTHQLPRAFQQCEPWLRAQYPQLMSDSPEMAKRIEELAKLNKPSTADIAAWVSSVRTQFGLPDMLPLEPMGDGMYTYIDPIEEARAMVGDSKVIVVEAEEARR